MTSERAPRPSAGATTVREYRAGDEAAILAARERCGASGEATFRPRSADAWRWRFVEDPGGGRVVVALAEGGRVVGAVLGVGRRVVLEGALASFGHVVDVFTEPDVRRGLARPGLAVRLGEAWAERHVGAPDVVVTGWPTPPAWRVVKVRLGAEVVRTQGLLVGGPRTWTDAAAPGVDVEAARSVPADVDDLFERARAAYPAIGVRDAAWYDWRFTRHPEHAYELGVARRAGRLVGLVWFRVGTFGGESMGLVCEWLVDPADEGARAALVAWSRERTAAGGVERTATLLPDSSPEALALQRLGMRVEPTPHFVVGREAGRGHDQRWMYHSWYYTFADTDFA